jgi:hypothetical protein
LQQAGEKAMQMDEWRVYPVKSPMISTKEAFLKQT